MFKPEKPEPNGQSLEELKRFYQGNPSARLLLDYFATRRRGLQRGYAIKVNSLEQLRLQGDEKLSRAGIIDVLKRLESFGYGKFIVGRHTQKSRFRWDVSMASVGKAAAGEGEIENIAPVSEDDEDEISTLQHSFRLRPDYTVTLALPLDFDTNEATRLADFIKTLPFASRHAD